MISVIIPARNERLLWNTVADIYEHMKSDIEIIVVLDGESEYMIPSPYRSDLRFIVNEVPKGIRFSINEAVKRSRGDYLLKVDAHCIFGDSFDDILAGDCDDNWVSVARRYTLNLETMERSPRIVDYFYLGCPWTHPRPLMMQSCPWITRTEERQDILIDDLMCFQGSMWFMSRKHWDRIGYLEIGQMEYAEHHEISMKTWLSGGRVVINKNTWYAHPRKPVSGYRMNMDTVYSDHDKSARYWTNNGWNKQVYSFDWLIDKFWPLPTEHNRHRLEKYYWPEDWRKYYDRPV